MTKKWNFSLGKNWKTCSLCSRFNHGLEFLQRKMIKLFCANFWIGLNYFESGFLVFAESAIRLRHFNITDSASCWCINFHSKTNVNVFMFPFQNCRWNFKIEWIYIDLSSTAQPLAILEPINFVCIQIPFVGIFHFNSCKCLSFFGFCHFYSPGVKE